MEPLPALGFPMGAEHRIAGNRTATKDHADGFQLMKASFPGYLLLIAG